MGPLTRAWLVAGVAGTMVCGCRDDPAAFEPTAPTAPPEGLFRLTLSPFDDAGPVWTPDGGEVVYAAGQTDLFPDATAALVAVPASGGQARAIAAPYQESLTFHRLAAPALSPDGERVAVVELRFTFPLVCGPGLTSSCGEFAPPDIPGPELAFVVISVRDVDGRADGPEVAISFADDFRLDGTPDTLLAGPYQRYYSQGGLPFRPTWSPDGRRVAFSDGDALFLWTPGEGAPQPVPGTELAVAPAWSPDGSTIAFVQLVGAPTEVYNCTCSSPSDTSAAARLLTRIAEHRLSLLDVESGEISVIGLGGRDPAWSPDGRDLYVARLGRLWRVPVDDPGLAEPIESTDDARHPAVSPDGSRLAFTVADPAGLGDIWILPLEPAP